MTCIMNILCLWIFVGALVSSNALGCGRVRYTEVSINASLKSQVFLPCHFNTSLNNETVIWSHNKDTLVKIIADGRIYFENPREGRVTAFPLLVEEGNFSILIHDLDSSEVGVYFCEWNSECWRVRITEIQNHSSQEIYYLSPWFYFAAGAGLFIMLFIVFSMISKLFGKDKSSESNSVNVIHSEGNYPVEQSRSHRNNRGPRRGPSVVYENDGPASYPSSAVQHGQHPQRAFTAVPEPTSHSDVKPYYVNQAELSISTNAGKKRKKQKPYQFKNPIYGE
ncbi:uncharacterized protein isoform X2 [Danio rerio]|uniref:Uncharacterized protein isoform X2 n=2 Tax=Danio rerio TaxID=7955 RepID=A0AC58HC98_DANRE|nr:uncharacterized protein LOC101884208 isoform X2 [Danio rerio]|eukprot:XP_017206588.1 uncharacterized protein LOC101884208 isoform X2 [Danio rerio]